MRRALNSSDRLALWNAQLAVRKPRRVRQLALLRYAIRLNRNGREVGIHLGVEGGASFDKDLRDLVQRRLLRMSREVMNANRDIGTQIATHAVLRITDAGRVALAVGNASKRI